MIPKSELNHLADLLKDFATKNQYTPEAAFTLIKSRFRAFEKSNFIPEICAKLKSIDQSGYPGLFRNFAKIIHHYIFLDILTNAGEYRRSSDPGGGLILFGGQKQCRLESKFKGVSADNIEHDLNKAFLWLGENGDPVENVLRFYQQFANIHPFYDANGRIARILMIVYLLINNLTIKREPFDQSKGKFLKRLNRCHERFGTDKSEEYFKYFFHFMNKFITPLNLNNDEC